MLRVIQIARFCPQGVVCRSSSNAKVNTSKDGSTRTVCSAILATPKQGTASRDRISMSVRKTNSKKHYMILYNRRGVASLVRKDIIGKSRPDRRHNHSRHPAGADCQVRNTPSSPIGRTEERAQAWPSRVARTKAKQREGPVGVQNLEDGSAVRPL